MPHLTDNKQPVEDFIKDIADADISRYRTYWQKLVPVNKTETYLRWLFAFLSIQTSWTQNVKHYLSFMKKYKLAYNADISNPNHLGNHKSEVKQFMESCKMGYYNRGQGIYEFHQKFWQNPNRFTAENFSNFLDMRDSIANRLYSIGLAKTAFAIEMCYPDQMEVVCLDRHMFRFYEVRIDPTKKIGKRYPSQKELSEDPSPTEKQYREYEAHWAKCCKLRSVPCAIARHIYWDQCIQSRSDSSYWSYVFHKPGEKYGVQRESPLPVLSTV